MPYNFGEIKYIPGLDGIRFFAISMVMISHFGFGKWVPGGFGVTIFFFLSGFLITTLLIQETHKKGAINVRNFYIRRILRLVPEMIALLVGSTLISWSMGLSPTAGDVIAALTYTTNYYIIYLQSISTDGTAQTWWGHLWSLSVEEHYYLTFPIIFSAIFGQPKRIFLFFAAVIVGCLAWRYFSLASGISAPNWHLAYGYLASEARYDSIAYGALFAYVAQRGARLSQASSMTALTAGLLMLVASLLIRDNFFRETFRYSLQGIGIFLVFSHFYLARKPSPLTKIADLAPFRMGGVLSYGAYLWHLEFIRVVYHFADISPASLPTDQKILFVLMGFVCSFSVAWLSYRYIATPVLKLRSNFGSHILPDTVVPEAKPIGTATVFRTII